MSTAAIAPSWIRMLTASERATFFATFAGWMLDGMDVMIFSFVVPSLMTMWKISAGEAGLLATSVLLVSAAGGWIAGLAADRFGRVVVLQITILWFAVFTFLSGFTNSFWELFTTRSLQGLGFGGEWAVGSVLIGETIGVQHRGRAVGTVQSGWAIGWGIAALFFTVFFSTMPPETAWRAMFWVGLLPALLIFYIRRNVEEPEIFRKRQTEANRASGPILQIFGADVLRLTLLASLVSVGAQGGYYAVSTWLPLYLKGTRHLSVLDTGGYLAVIIAGSFTGYLTSAHLTDRIGRKRTLILFAAMSLVTAVLYTALPINNSVMLVLGFPLGFFASGTFSPMGAFFTELFPTRMRGSAQGFSYNFGRGVGALFPALVGYLSAQVSLGDAIAAFSAIAYAIMIVAVLALPETRGRELS